LEKGCGRKFYSKEKLQDTITIDVERGTMTVDSYLWDHILYGGQLPAGGGGVLVPIRPIVKEAREVL